MSIGNRVAYGLFKRTPKFLSPLNKSKINTPICIKPIFAKQKKQNKDLMMIICVGSLHVSERASLRK